jgi:class 3 adenylate cyclase/tetratricopeptide (TPR) repeat protein
MAADDASAADLVDDIQRWRNRCDQDASLAWRRRFVEHFLEIGEPLVAYDAAVDALATWPDDVPLRQLRGLSLSRSGAVEAAAEAFRALVAEGHGDEETLGNLARTYKSLWLADRHGPDAETHRRAAEQAYAEAHRRTGGYWTAINAATLALAGGQTATAAALAQAALQQCTAELAGAPPDARDRYWLHATRGEAALILGRWSEALDEYRAAAALAGRRYANVATTRSQARLLAEYLDVDATALDACFALPRVVVCTGHMIDAPGRSPPRFPSELADVVQREIARRLADWGPVLGYSSAACGADLLFLECLLERGDDAVIVLPLPVEQFIAQSVAFAEEGQWVARFERALRRCAAPVAASRAETPPTGAAFDFANRLLCGLAKLQADALDVPLTLLAVWDGAEQGPPGGTADLVGRWRAQGLPLETIALAALRARPSTFAAAPAAPPDDGAQAGAASASAPQQLLAMLFADVRGFSRLADAQMAPFVDRFLGAIGALPAACGIEPLCVNTWGDGYFAAFQHVVEAGEFALSLVETLQSIDWSAYGLPAELSVRVALHAGPVFALHDPITHRPGYWGEHVSRAARIEPITPPGQVYASQAFAALARDETACPFRCEYVGRTPLAKDYGVFPTYHVARRSEVPRRKGL